MQDLGSSRGHAPAVASALERRMLSGEPFSYGGISAERAKGAPYDGVVGDADRLIDRTIQKLRRKGLIEWRRVEGKGVQWTPVATTQPA